MLIEHIIKEITLEFIDHWNKLDIAKVVTYLKEDVILYSPNINLIYPDNKENKIIGKNNVYNYWTLLKNNFSHMIFTLETFKKIDDYVYIISEIEGKNEKLYTTFRYNEYGKIIEIKFEYK